MGTRKETATIPSTKTQKEKVAEFLDSDATEGKPLEEVASIVVDGFHKLLKSSLKRPILLPHVGTAFKHPALSGVWHVAWAQDTKLWLVSATARYGWFTDQKDQFWEYAEESTAKSGAPNNNPDWNVGDQVSQSQRQATFEVVATGDKCVLLRNMKTGVHQVDSNENMERHYRRESNVKDDEW